MAQQHPNSSHLDRHAIEALVWQALNDYLLPVGERRVAAAPRLVVNISARHAHLDQQGLEILFGKGTELKVQKELYQEGAFAAEQTVTIFGPRKQMIANLRILGPLRGRCQVELSFTDARFLGINAPVRLSGDHRETPGCYLVGPAGGLEMGSGVIRAARHVHMNPLEAEFYGIGDGDRMRLVVDSEQGGALEGVVCRVSEQGKLEVHLDTDEGNGMDVMKARKVHLEK